MGFLPLEELELCPHLCPRSFCKWLVLRIATRLLVVLLELWAISPRQLMLPLQRRTPICPLICGRKPLSPSLHTKNLLTFWPKTTDPLEPKLKSKKLNNTKLPNPCYTRIKLSVSSKKKKIPFSPKKKKKKKKKS